MKFKIIALVMLSYIGFCANANADIYLRNQSSFNIDRYYGNFWQAYNIPKFEKSNSRFQHTDGYTFPDTLGNITSDSIDITDHETSLQLAVHEGYNRLVIISFHEKGGAYGHAQLATTPTFNPETYIYNLSDNLLVTIINNSDEKKYDAQCWGSNPCAVVLKVNSK